MAKKRINITISEHILSRIDELAEENGIVRSGFVSMILKQYVDSQDMLKLANVDKVDKASMVEMLEQMKEVVQAVPAKSE